MKNIRFLTFVLAIATMLLSACGAAANTATPAAESAGLKVDAMPVAFVGIVDSITGDQWVISGTKVTVDQSIVRDGPFNVGDRIKVEGFVNPDGSLKVSRVETATPQDAATQPPFVADNSNDANVNDDNSNGINSNDASTNVNDDNSSSVNSNDASTNVNDDHGTDVNTNDDNSSSVNSNDTSTNVNDDHGTDVNTNNDNGSTANSNDDKGGASNSNDDKGGGGNSNDDNGNGG